MPSFVLRAAQARVCAVLVALAGMLGTGTSVAQNPYQTFAFNANLAENTCNSGSHTSPAHPSPAYLFRATSPESGATNCSTDSNGWAWFTNASYRINRFSAYMPSAHLDFAGFDIRNDSGGPVTLAIACRDGNAQPRGSESVEVQVGVTTVTLAAPITYARFCDIDMASEPKNVAFNNFRMRVWTPSVPDAPTIGTATAGSGSATLTFSAPSNNGGAAITGYTATVLPDMSTVSCTGSPCTINNLSNGSTYRFTVAAVNSAGTGADSAESNAVTPRSSNAALSSLVPSSGALSPSFASGTLSYTLAVANGTSSITLTPTTSDSAATVTVAGQTTSSGSASPSISLPVGRSPCRLERPMSPSSSRRRTAPPPVSTP